MAETVPDTLKVKPCSVPTMMVAGTVTSAKPKPKLSVRGSARRVLGSTLDVKLRMTAAWLLKPAAATVVAI